MLGTGPMVLGESFGITDIGWTAEAGLGIDMPLHQLSTQRGFVGRIGLAYQGALLTAIRGSQSYAYLSSLVFSLELAYHR